MTFEGGDANTLTGLEWLIGIALPEIGAEDRLLEAYLATRLWRQVTD